MSFWLKVIVANQLATKLNVRAEPHTAKKNVVGTLNCGDVVALDGASGDRNEWYKIKLEKLKGYSHGAFIVPLRPGARRPLCESDQGTKHKPTAEEDAGKDPPLQITVPTHNVKIPLKGAPGATPAIEPAPMMMASAEHQKPEEHPQAEHQKPEEHPQAEHQKPEEHAQAEHQKPMEHAQAEHQKPEEHAQAEHQKPEEHAQAEHQKPHEAAKPAGKTARISAPDQMILSKQPPATALPVAFSHDQHAGLYACYKCHHPVSREGGVLKHVTRGVETNEEYNCHTCHKQGGAQGEAKSSARFAFHKNCRDCHRASGNPKAPIGCNECHKAP